MHATDPGPIAVRFELEFAPLGPYRPVLRYEDSDELFDGPLCTSDMRKTNAD